MKNKLLTLRFLDLLIWLFILAMFVYNAFVAEVTSRVIWFIAIILMLISIIIKLFYIIIKHEK